MEETVTITRKTYDDFIELRNEYEKAEIAIRNRFIKIGFNGSFYTFDAAERCRVIESLETELKTKNKFLSVLKDERKQICKMSILGFIKWKKNSVL